MDAHRQEPVAFSRVDGFNPEHTRAFKGYDPDVARRFFAVVRTAAQRLHISVEGLENIPAGRALLVGNHTFGWDSMFVMEAITRALGRRVWALGEHAWWQFPVIRRLATGVGVVDGTPENVDALLSSGELVFVLPGGLREAVKPRGLRYRLLWGQRYGFVRAAIHNQAPIVPVAAIGADDLFDLVGDAYGRGERWLRRRGIPIPLPSRILPIPHRTRIRFVVGEPIVPPVPASLAEDAETLKTFRWEVEGALHELIERELAAREGIAIDR